MLVIFLCPSGLGSDVTSLWVGVVQRNPNQTGHRRDYKWLRSGVNILSSSEIWRSRYVSGEGATTACAVLRTQDQQSKLNDVYCTKLRGFICEW